MTDLDGENLDRRDREFYLALEALGDKIDASMNQMRDRHHDSINRISSALGRLEVMISTHAATPGHGESLRLIGSLESEVKMLRGELSGAVKVMRDEFVREVGPIKTRVTQLWAFGVAAIFLIGVFGPQVNNLIFGK